MTAWWIVAGVLIVVVLPTVAVLAATMVKAALELRQRVDELAVRCQGLPSRLTALEELARTPLLVRDMGGDMQRYRAALATIVGRRRR